MLEEGKAELQEELVRERSMRGNGGDGLTADPKDPLERRTPGVVLISEQMDPFIEGGDSDMPMFTESSYRAGPVKITQEYSQYEPQRVGTVRDEDIGENSVGMAAGFAQETRDGQRCLFSMTTGYRNHVTFVRSRFAKAAHRTAARTGAFRRLKTGYGQGKEPPVRKM